MKNSTILLFFGAAGLGFLAYLKLTESKISDKVQTLTDGLRHPFEALGANFMTSENLEKTYGKGTAKLSPDFQKYIDSNGGSEAFIKAHKQGTFKGKPFIPNSNVAIKNNQINPNNLSFIERNFLGKSFFL